MSAATDIQPVNREEIRMLVLNLGYQRTSERTGIKQATLRQWAKRFAWKPNHSQETVTSVTKPSQVLADELAENERETRLSLSRYARRAAKDSEQATLKDAPYVKGVAQVAGITHKWGDQEGKASHFTLNVLNLNSLEVREEPTLEAE